MLSCKQQDSNKPYQITGIKTISLGSENSIIDERKINNNYRLCINTTLEEELPNGKTRPIRQSHFLELALKNDSIKSIHPVEFNYFLTDYVELEDCFFVLTTEPRTMGEYTRDYLNKYDKSWQLLWSKNIDKPKYPDGNSVIKLTNQNELLVIANEHKIKAEQVGLSFSRYDLDGELIEENFVEANYFASPTQLIQTKDNGFFLTVEQYDSSSADHNLWLIKLNNDGDTLWSKKYPKLIPKETIITTDGDLVFYGSNYSSKEEEKAHYHFLKILVVDNNGNTKWQKIIKQNYYESPGNVIETSNNSLLFVSTIEPVKDKKDNPYLFELDKNGALIFEKNFEYSVGTNSIPFLLEDENQIKMVGEEYIGGGAFNDRIHIMNLKK